MTVDPASPLAATGPDWKTYRFCSEHCRKKFLQGLPPPAPPASQKSARDTWPMHAEVVRDAHGSCPKCGMALEPMEVMLEEEENPELIDMTRRLWIGAALSAPVFLLGMAEMIPGQPV